MCHVLFLFATDAQITHALFLFTKDAQIAHVLFLFTTDAQITHVIFISDIFNVLALLTTLKYYSVVE